MATIWEALDDLRRKFLFLTHEEKLWEELKELSKHQAERRATAAAAEEDVSTGNTRWHALLSKVEKDAERRTRAKTDEMQVLREAVDKATLALMAWMNSDEGKTARRILGTLEADNRGAGTIVIAREIHEVQVPIGFGNVEKREGITTWLFDKEGFRVEFPDLRGEPARVEAEIFEAVEAAFGKRPWPPSRSRPNEKPAQPIQPREFLAWLMTSIEEAATKDYSPRSVGEK